MFNLNSSSQKIIQCFFINYNPNRSSSSIAEGLAETDWVDASEEMKKNIQLIILRAQKPKAITAYKFSEVSIGSFTKVSKIANVIEKCFRV